MCINFAARRRVVHNRRGGVGALAAPFAPLDEQLVMSYKDVEPDA
jgi:hypothetical protein